MPIYPLDLTKSLPRALQDCAEEWQRQFWDLKTLEESLIVPGYVVFYQALAQDASVWQGVLLAKESVDDHELLFLYVRTAARRLGVGSNLLSGYAAWCRAANKERIFLEVRLSHSATQSLYRAGGFRQVHVRKAYYRDGEDAVIMEKRL